MNTIRTTIPPQSPRLLDQLRLHMRQQGLAYRTEQTYIHWTRRFINFHNQQHPKDLGAEHIEQFLGYLSNQRYSQSIHKRLRSTRWYTCTSVFSV